MRWARSSATRSHCSVFSQRSHRRASASKSSGSALRTTSSARIGLLRVVELLVEAREAIADLAALLRVGDELELALERVGGGREVSRALPADRRWPGGQGGTSDRAPRGPARSARSRCRRRRCPRRAARLRAARRGPFRHLSVGEGAEAAEERRRLGVVLALDGVVDEAFERLAVVAVVEHLEPLLARGVLVVELRRVERCAAWRRIATRLPLSAMRSPRLARNATSLSHASIAV